jgi:putative component of membrane protein insertase Oxa1/YidC/SpoIIIJ protein YidD
MLNKIIIVFFLISSFQGNSQDEVLQKSIIYSTLNLKTNESSQSQKTYLSTNNKKQVFNPLRYIAGGLLYTYQHVFSEQISANCKYHVSCSEATKRYIEKKGLIFGTLLGLHQLSNCTKNAHYDFSEYLIDEHEKINNTIE